MPADHHTDAPPEVVCHALSKSFAGPSGPVEALRPLSVTFSAGQTTALVGPSGCGKSTVLRLIVGLEEPSSGSVEIGGVSPREVRRAGDLAVGFQDPSLLPWRSVRGNVALARQLARRPADPAAVERLIDLVGLSGFAEMRPGGLSGGMRQRAAIARCLVTEPGLLLLDEPFGAVDELTRRRLADELPRLWQARGTTTLFVTHSVDEAVLLADRVLVFSPRPAEVVGDIPVEFPHPRGAELTHRPEFRELRDVVASALAAGLDRPSPAVAAQ